MKRMKFCETMMFFNLNVVSIPMHYAQLQEN